MKIERSLAMTWLGVVALASIICATVLGLDGTVDPTVTVAVLGLANLAGGALAGVIVSPMLSSDVAQPRPPFES